MEPETTLDQRYSMHEAVATPWAQGLTCLTTARRWLLTTVRPQGRPHSTPVVGAVHADALWFCSGPGERKTRNLAGNPAVVISAPGGTDGLDVVVEGRAEVVEGEEVLRAVARALVRAHGESWRFTVADGRFHHPSGTAVVHRVRPVVAFGFATQEPWGQTRWRFRPAASTTSS